MNYEKQLRRLIKEARRLSNVCWNSVVTPEDLERLDKAIDSVENQLKANRGLDGK